MGTPSYMAPEQAGGKSKEWGRPATSTRWGRILYELLDGPAAVQGGDAAGHDPAGGERGAGAADAVEREGAARSGDDLPEVFAKEPGRRYASARRSWRTTWGGIARRADPGAAGGARGAGGQVGAAQSVVAGRWRRGVWCWWRRRRVGSFAAAQPTVAGKGGRENAQKADDNGEGRATPGRRQTRHGARKAEQARSAPTPRRWRRREQREKTGAVEQLTRASGWLRRQTLLAQTYWRQRDVRLALHYLDECQTEPRRLGARHLCDALPTPS